MSALSRFLSASAASWANILLTITTQIVLVPVFLGHWSVEQYGYWLIVQTINSISSVMSSGHHAYIGYESLRLGDRQPKAMRMLFYSALPWAVLIAVFELLIIICAIHFGVIDKVLDANSSLPSSLLSQILWALMLYSAYRLVTNSIGGLAGRTVAAYGYFPRMAWWATLLAMVMALASGFAVTLGADLLQTVVCTVIAGFIVNIAIHLDLWLMFKRHEINPIAPDWRRGLRRVVNSSAIAASTVLDISRQHGVRVLLGAIVGVGEMTAFSTTRTMNNLALQGIGTITNPIMPEIMRFLRGKDTERTHATMGFVWFFAVVLLSPALIFLQWIVPVIFHGWTRGKILFDPALFGLFSMTLLMYSVARPPFAVLQGNNLLKIQLWLSIAVSAIAITGILLFTARIGVAGAAAALLIAEAVGTVFTVWFAWKWLDANGIGFPWRLFGSALSSIAVAGGGISVMVLWPKTASLVLIVSLFLSFALSLNFFRYLPPLAKDRVWQLIGHGREELRVQEREAPVHKSSSRAGLSAGRTSRRDD